MQPLKDELSHIYWIGGSPCAGKSSLADALVIVQEAQRYAMPVLEVDGSRSIAENAVIVELCFQL